MSLTQSELFCLENISKDMTKLTIPINLLSLKFNNNKSNQIDNTNITPRYRSGSGGRKMPELMLQMMEVKKAIKAKYTNIKDGPALTRLIMENIKSKGAKGAIDAIQSMEQLKLLDKLEQINKDITLKRAAKK